MRGLPPRENSAMTDASETSHTIQWQLESTEARHREYGEARE